MPEYMLIYTCMFAAAATAAAGQNRSSASPGASGAPSVSAPSTMVPAHSVAPITADVTLTIINPDGSEQDQQGRYFRSSNGNVREDLASGSVITDVKAGTITTLNPATNQAIVISTPGPQGRYVQSNSPSAAAPTMSALGQTTVEGHPVSMSRMTLNASNGQSAEVWTATDIRLIVLLKAISSTGRTTTKQYTNIQTVEPDPSLFTVPQGYTIVVKTSNNIPTSISVQH